LDEQTMARHGGTVRGTARFGGARTGLGLVSGDRPTNNEVRWRAPAASRVRLRRRRGQGREIGSAGREGERRARPSPFIERERERKRASGREKGATAAVPARRKWEEKWEGEERTPLDAP
jgi:hypothetical protein